MSMLFDEFEHAETMSLCESRQLAESAKVLISKGGWSGADREFLERIADGNCDDPDSMQQLEDAETREMEENLNRFR